MPGTQAHLILTTTQWGRLYPPSIVRMRKLRFTEVEFLAQVHTASKQWHMDLNPKTRATTGSDCSPNLWLIASPNLDPPLILLTSPRFRGLPGHLGYLPCLRAQHLPTVWNEDLWLQILALENPASSRPSASEGQACQFPVLRRKRARALTTFIWFSLLLLAISTNVPALFFFFFGWEQCWEDAHIAFA